MSTDGNRIHIFLTSLRSLVNITQRSNESTDQFQQRLTDAYNAVKLAGGEEVFKNATLTDPVKKAATNDKMEETEEAIIAMLMVCRSDPNRYTSMIQKLQDESHLGNDNFPKTIRKAYHAINNHSVDSTNRHRNGNSRFRADVHFAQGKAVPGTDGKLYRDTICY
jgi:hypothetical protein